MLEDFNFNLIEKRDKTILITELIEDIYSFIFFMHVFQLL